MPERFETPMSEFDKEAEREKLRKKFAEEDRKRETTEHMSELLLRGATMLNAHCDECGSPLFRYEGQEFCPTCQQTVDAAAEDGAVRNATDGIDEAVDSSDAATMADGQRAPSSDEREHGTADQRGAVDQRGPADQGPASVPVEPTGGDESAPSKQQSREARPARDAAGQAGPTTGSDQSETTATTGATATGSDPRAALEEAIRTLTRRATVTDDPGRAREFLEAAKEAAETLAILEPNR